MAARLDLLLVNPNTKNAVYQGLSTRLTALEPPVWAGLIASFVRRKGRSVAILDAEAEGLSPAEVGERVAAIAPRLLAIPAYGHQPSASTQVMPGVRQAAAAVRETAPGLPILLLGGHVAALPKRTLEEEPCDYVAGGEGLHTLTDLLECLETSTGQLVKVRGLYWRDEGNVVVNPPAPLVQNLDEEMPGVAWDLLPMERYRAHNWHCFGEAGRQPYAALYTTLGCPYHCNFCCIQAPFKDGELAVGVRAEVNSYRYWSTASVLAQIDELVRVHGVRHLKIADEMFVLGKRHVTALCRGIAERGYDLNIWAYSRVDTVAEGLLEEMKPAGVRWLALGIEAASERVREDAQKGIGRTDVEAVVRRIREAGLYIIGNYIFGLPEDDLSTMQQTLDLATDLNCEFANFYVAMAYPGSQLYRDADANGWRLPDGWSGYSQHAVDTLPLPTRHVTAAHVLRFRDQAFRRYFENPSYLEMVRRTFGEATVAEVMEMLSVQLVRQNA